MITTDNFSSLLLALNFEFHTKLYRKVFENGAVLIADFEKQTLIYPEDKGLIINERQTCNFLANENFVVFECVHRLLEKGYLPESIELEPKWKVGHGASGGRADILIKDRENKPLLIIECKTAGNEYAKALKYTQFDGGQLFSYAQQIPATPFLCLYASDFNDKKELKRDYFVISHQDNANILSQDSQLKSFKQAQNVIERFDVWKNTYQLESLPPVIFEDKSQAYQIGKDKIELEDLNPLDARDKEGKYHQFRTILRKHNVARRENAFEVLVNLFLCKIVDETEHTDDLKFYWKGIAYDNYFDLVDRLQSLYQKGMGRFLNQDIVYISNAEIDNAFWAVKNDKNAAKQKIKEIFKQLKFYKGLDFDFIKVHNKDLFNKNAKVLIEIVQMWQESRLKTDAQNQFLGDMFEYFLDNSIKQSEGQFFTPMPICRFILMALPLPELIRQSEYAPKMIDYACGAGHFLNEYAAQIKPFALENTQQPLKSFYANIVGIEKEDRLAKVAKVSAFMYGQDEIKIIDADALANHTDIKNNSFNCLVANPPFAVEGFLETLAESERENYQLFNTVADVLSNRNIQCFFIERAAQLLAPKGIAGIIVPSSVLSNSDATHIGAREQLLKQFDIVALVELGSGTFGKTGTNTVVLFLRRKYKQPTESEQYFNRVNDWFNQDKEGDIYQDGHFIKHYCDHIGIAFEAYDSLLKGEPSAALLATELFKDYQKIFNNSTEIKNLEKQKSFKDKTAAEKDREFRKRFLNFLQVIEKDKLFYFVMAFENPQKVLVVKSPADNKEQKAFLGYEWSSAKGNEGIKLTTDSNGHHSTPLYDVTNRDNPEKINFLIAQNFLGNELNLSGFENLVSTTRLQNMLDFSRVNFDKTISLTAKKSVEIETQWRLKKLGDVCDILIGGTPSRKVNSYFTGNNLWVSISEMKGQIITDTKEKITDEGVKNSNVKLIPKGTTLLSFKLSIGKTAIAGADLYTNEAIAGLIPKDKDTLLDSYLYQLFTAKLIDLENTGLKAFGQSLNSQFLKEDIKIPVPDKDIQEKIVGECESIDSEVEKAEQIIKSLNINITEFLMDTNKNTEIKKLASICNMKAGQFVSASDINDNSDIDLYPCYGGNGLRGYTKTFTHDGTFPLIGRQGALCGNVHKVTGKFHATEHAIVVMPFLDINVNWLYYQLKLLKLNQYKTGIAQPGLSVKNLETVLIPVPDLPIQKTLVAEIEILETKIAAAQKIINESAAKKQAILKKYL